MVRGTQGQLVGMLAHQATREILGRSEVYAWSNGQTALESHG